MDKGKYVTFMQSIKIKCLTFPRRAKVIIQILCDLKKKNNFFVAESKKS